MIARFRILLPFEITISAEEHLEPFDVEVRGLRARVYPPYRSAVDRAILEVDSRRPLSEVIGQLGPAVVEPNPDVLLNGQPTFQANVLQIDFYATEFDRSADSHQFDPLTIAALELANRVLRAQRAFARAGWIRELPRESLWRIEFLNDDETQFEPDPERRVVRARNALSWTWRFTSLTPHLWSALQALPEDFEPAPWHDLLLDATDLTSQIGPALVLAATAVETRIESAVDLLARQARINEELWVWINDRGDYRKEPSVAERADALLHAVTGRSLKDEPALWEAFKNLRDARNSFVHDGCAVIGSTTVDVDKTRELVAKSYAIVDWLDSLLPSEHRRPPYEPEGTVESTRTVFSPPVAEPEPPAKA